MSDQLLAAVSQSGAPALFGIVAIAAIKFEEQLEAAKARINRQLSTFSAQVTADEAAALIRALGRSE